MTPALPLIALRSFTSVERLATELMRVGRNPGFFYLTGHELTDSAAKPMFDLAGDFFRKTPKEEKMRFVGSGGLGYTGFRDEKLSGKGRGDLKESFYMANPKGSVSQSLPKILDHGKEEIAEFYGKCEAITERLLEAFAVGLKLPQDYLSSRHKGECSRLRIISYPPVPSRDDNQQPTGDEEDIRAGGHTDYGSITLLFRQPDDKGGLQVLLDDEHWIDIPCIKDAIVVNIADALEFWTSGRLRSTVHRVVFPRTASENAARLSIPFFVQPDADVLMAPMSQEGANQDEFNEVLKRKCYSSAKPLTAGEHLTQRSRATYGHQ
ncbi:hypothetical protein FQN55_002653 [Onygenales sp. PD_40]|nr:hypothetical protein FQN55_002653 [Onygenales sp. PD_40]KAK2780049.1 hypothetical protein FQN52_002274 [Onygenales sp. PD_12]KAK2800916.1 hypothetical protein FQN51_005851 [Onygenales sp. PD_10]